MVSTVDPDARHGHKTAARGFDGYKGHAAADPDSEIITATAVTPGNTGDATTAEAVLIVLGNVAALRVFDLAEILRERHLLVVGDVLVMEHQHRVTVHAGLDRRSLLARQGL